MVVIHFALAWQSPERHVSADGLGGQVLPWVANKGLAQARAMTSYAMFFLDQLGVDVYPVQAMDPVHAMAIVRLPGRSDHWKLLFAWLDAIDVAAAWE